MAQQDVLDYIRKTPHNSNVNVVKGMLNAEGGGGSSDFSTATMTVVNNSDGSLSVECPFIIDMGEFEIPLAIISVDPHDTSVWDIILYKGKTGAVTVTSGVTVSGNITDMGEGSYLVTGDCTITISGGR